MAASKKEDFAKKRSLAFSKMKNKMFGKSIFNFPNGDIYIGSYKLSPPDTLTMTGHGMYICSDGMTFRGDWDKNEFIYGRVKFPSGEEYTGNLCRHLFHGEGSYWLPGTGRVMGNFREHSPVESLILVDQDGRIWRAEAEAGTAEFCQANPFLEQTLYPRDYSFITRPLESTTPRQTGHQSQLSGL